MNCTSIRSDIFDIHAGIKTPEDAVVMHVEKTLIGGHRRKVSVPSFESEFR